MTNKRNFAKIVLLVVIALTIIKLAVTLSGEVTTTSPWGSNSSTPTIVVTQPAPIEGQLAWECPGCPHP